MPIYQARYELFNGYVHNWLVAGPQAISVPDLGRFQGEDWKLQIARHFCQADSGVTQQPVQDAALVAGDAKLDWQYYRCADDHYVDRTAFYHICHYLRSWAYCRVVSPSAQTLAFILTTNGPADVWLNGEHVHRQEHFHHQLPHSVSFSATLRQGTNEVLVRFEEVAARECPYAVALRLVDALPGTQVVIPTSHKGVARRAIVEGAIQAAYLDRDTYVWDDEITVHWPREMASSVALTVRLQEPAGWIHSEGRPTVTAGHKAPMGMPYSVPEGPLEILLLPTLHEYYEGNLRLERKIPLTSLRNRYSQAPYGTLEERRQEALRDAAEREDNVFSEIAKMALGRWANVKTDVIAKAIQGINQRKDCSDFYLVGLLGMMYRYGQDPSFPPEIRQPLEECILNFRYWADEPGSDAMWFWSENHQILFHTCQVLAGQLYPQRIFTNTGQPGQWHKEKGEERALSWLLKRGAGGFSEWDSNCYFEEDLLALAHLADLAESQAVYDLSAVVMDKMFFTMALNSYKGTFGSTHGRTYTPHIRGARQESTAGVSRLMWGMGAFNRAILATVSLACMENYPFPQIIGDIAADLPDEVWDRERHGGELETWCDLTSGRWEVNKVTYKTPDYMLCSAQDYHPGEKGLQQHVWQATFGPDAVVFASHPPCLSDESSHRPGFWHGNVVLPRVAQWKDVLVAIHKLPADDWLGFTHAYFPAWAFDENLLRQDAGGRSWAFARKGEGYLALTAAQGLEFVTHGDSAYRELRSHGRHNAWLCQLGRAALDGDFAAFQDRILALDVSFGDLSVRCATLRGERLAFAWEGPLLRNDVVQPITGFKHYENPYCTADLPASDMEIRHGDQAMRLDFAAPQASRPPGGAGA